MKRLTYVLLVVAWLPLLLVTGCGANSSADQENGPSTDAAATEPPLPEVTPAEARAAMSDAMLASAISLFLAFEAEPGSSSMSNPDGSLTLEWDESSDFSTGVGSYTITMDEFTVSGDEVYASEYNGYSLSGTVVMSSSDGVNTTILMDLQARHSEPDSNPVRSIRMELEGVDTDGTVVPTGEIVVNGREMEFRELADVFRVGE